MILDIVLTFICTSAMVCLLIESYEAYIRENKRESLYLFLSSLMPIIIFSLYIYIGEVK